MWKNLVEPGRSECLRDNVEKPCRAGQATDDHLAHARYILAVPEPTNTHSEYVILIALPPQQWLNESVSMLLYTCIVCLVYSCHVYRINIQVTP
jgi:hypothetical protein